MAIGAIRAGASSSKSRLPPRLLSTRYGERWVDHLSMKIEGEGNWRPLGRRW
jgi:hypothetical protein